MPPSHRPGGFALTLGVFVRFRDGQVRLVDHDHNVYDLSRVRLAQGTWGDSVEGVQKLPRVQVRDNQTGELLVPGDQVLIGFLRGQPKTPYVLGGVRPPGSNDVLARDHLIDGADQNALKVLLVARDDRGTEGGTVYVEAGAGDGGAVLVQATAGVTVQVSDPIGAATATTLALDASTASVSSTGSPEPGLKGASFLAQLQTWNAGMTTFLAALAADATNPAIQAAAVAMATAHAAFVAQVSASVASQGTPLLSTTWRTD